MYKAPNIQSPKTENCHQLGGVHVRISQNSEFFFPHVEFSNPQSASRYTHTVCVLWRKQAESCEMPLAIK